MVPIVSAGRLRKSPFHESTIKDGAESLLTYNRMLIPRGYGDCEAEYWRLINGVSMWDVAVQRQVQIKGPDAAELTQILCTRDLSQQVVGQGKYVALCDHNGVLINDPIAMKIGHDCYWLSIGNSDIWFWARCVAGERNLKVDISEPDVSPMAIQGPKAENVVASLFGDWIRKLGYFWFKDVMLDNIPITLMRAGWSKQGKFELFLKDGTKGNQLWDIVKEAGQPFDIGPGYPNPSERTESGLLNWGTDTDDETNPFEVRLARFIDLDIRDDVLIALGAATALSLMTRAYQLTQTSYAVIFEYVYLISAGFFSWLIWDIAPNMTSIAGILMIVMAGLVIIFVQIKAEAG